MDLLSCDICGASVAESETDRHMAYHQMMVDSFVGFVKLIKAIAPDLEIEIESLENRHQE